jgi:2-succinyl-6-hydroxy-2,4-cyclohexadiene-1-carboxylate synthase
VVVAAAAEQAGGRAAAQAQPGAASRLVLVHGFTQTGASMARLAARLCDHARERGSSGLELVRPDLPGHGGSAAVLVPMGEAARLLGEAGGAAAYLGYSLGGRVCLRLAVERPELVRALVLLGASPGLAQERERAERRAADERLAQELERDGVAPFLDRWLAQPLFATLPASAAGYEERLANSAEGLAAALRLLGVGSQPPLWDHLAALSMPVLLLAGALDEKFSALATRMAAAIGPNARVALIPGAGHAAHLQRPDEVAALVAEFLARG